MELTCLFRQPTLLNAMAVQSGLVESLCQVAAGVSAALTLESHKSHVQAPSTAELPEAESDVFLHAVLALAYLAYEDRPTATVVASSIFKHNCAANVARTIMSGFVRASPLSSSRSSFDKSSGAASTASFTTHSTQLIGLLALLVCHDPGVSSSGAEHRHILIGDSALSALQLFAGSWPFLQCEGRRWAAVAVCSFLPLACSQSQTSTSTLVSSSIISPHGSALLPKVNHRSDAEVSSVVTPVAPSTPHPSLSSKYIASPRLISSVPAGPSAAMSSYSRHPEQEQPSAPSDDHGIMSALYANHYARFHPPLTFALRLQVHPYFRVFIFLPLPSLLLIQRLKGIRAHAAISTSSACPAAPATVAAVAGCHSAPGPAAALYEDRLPPFSCGQEISVLVMRVSAGAATAASALRALVSHRMRARAPRESGAVSAVQMADFSGECGCFGGPGEITYAHFTQRPMIMINASASSR